MKQIEIKDEYYFYLDALRDSGEINMFEAPRHLRDEFGISKQIAFAVFASWAKSKEKKQK